LKNTVKIIENF